MSTASTRYISIGANRSSSGAASSSSGILAYAAGTTVALWNTNDTNRGVYSTLLGHKGQVTTVKCAGESDARATFVSGDGVGEVRVWAEGENNQFNCTHSFIAHSGASVSAIGIIPTSGTAVEILSGGSDGSVKRWRVGQEGKVEQVQVLDIKGRLPLDLDVALLPGSTAPVLIVGCTDRKVQVWTLKDDMFKHMLSLEGHEDWVRCVSLTPYLSADGTGTDLLLATGAQDNYIRLWRIAPLVTERKLDLLDEFESRLGGSAGAALGQISTKSHVLGVEGHNYNITLEALLIGHEAGLTNVHWSPSPSPVLLSSAADNSLIIWSPTEGASGSESRDGIWVPEHRFGAFGGRGLAFFGAVWGPGGDSVVATGWTGGVERWVRSATRAGWDAAPGVTGHYGSVRSVAWDPRGDYLLTTSSDQTSRIHAACEPTASTSEKPVWSEIARPQIHGYDMVDGAFLSPFRFASCGEEKVFRVFEGTAGFAGSLRGLGVRDVVSEEEAKLPIGATVPPLGLSNRALGKDMTEPEIKTQNESRDSVSTALTTLPTEEELNTSTLWPEIEKIYGHGYELAVLATSNAGDLIATASRASSAEHATVRVVSTSTWGLLGEPLAGHSLTVTRIAFSPDDKLLLTVSRDRGWRLFARGDGDVFTAVAGEDKAHARMVLDCAWVSTSSFATASRDKTVKLWSVNDAGAWSCTSTLKLADAATALAITPSPSANLLAVGTESGAIEVFTVTQGEGAPLVSVPKDQGHASAVNRLAWRVNEGKEYLLASAGEDRAVRIFDVRL